jgi:hypothetical protein
MISSKNEKGRHQGSSLMAASKSFGQPRDSAVAILMVPVELYFLAGHLRQNGHPVLDTQSLDLPVPELIAEADELPPCWGEQARLTFARHQRNR